MSDIAQLKEVLGQRQPIGLTTDLLARGVAMTHERACVLAAHNAHDDNIDVADPELRIVRD